MPKGIWNARDVTSSSSKTADMPLEGSKDMKNGRGEDREGCRGIYTRKKKMARSRRGEERRERIAGSECKSTASDQSTTRTTRNRKDSLFLFIFVNVPPLLRSPLPSHSTSLHLFSPPFSKIFFSRWRFDGRSRDSLSFALCCHVVHRKILYLLKCDSIFNRRVARQMVYWRDIDKSENKITACSYFNALWKLKGRNGLKHYFRIRFMHYKMSN